MTTASVFAHPAERILRPTEENLRAAWTEIFDANAEQEAQLRETDAVEDYWAPGRRDHQIYRVNLDDIWPPTEFLRTLARPDDAWLDIGAGAGEAAIFLSGIVRRVLAIDPSPGMTALMRKHVAEYRADNVEVLAPQPWPPLNPVEQVDVCYTQAVTFFVRDIGGFLDAMESHARRLCVVVATERGTGWQAMEPVFEALHGERFVKLTGTPELLATLAARRRAVNITTFPTTARGAEDLDSAHARVRDDYYVRPGSEKDILLRTLLQEHFGVGDGQVRMPVPPGNYVAVISWEPPQT